MVKAKPAVVIDKESDGCIIAQKFADHFQQSCTPDDTDHPHTVNSEELHNLAAYISCAKADDFCLLDVETVNTCLAQMAKGKAPGVDGIQVEHLIYAHPMVIVLLCVLFNIMLTHGVVPTLFSSGIIVPILKDKHGDSSDINNYRAITLSPCISKLFEKCLLTKFGHLLAVSPLQYGFQKKLSCSHAIYTLRAVTDYYVAGLSTVNVAMLDLRKAFDRVKHDTLFTRLMKLNVPPTVLRLLMAWYKHGIVSVRWGAHSSYTFPLRMGVRQGGVLSPVFFCVYIDGLIRRLESTRLGCWIGDCYVGCILYADDLLLLSPSVCHLQNMVDICVEEATKINMSFNPKKCAVLRFGPRYNSPCAAVHIQGTPTEFVASAKYLGIMLRASRHFAVDLHHMKAQFYKSFNSVFHRACRLKDELVTLHLVSSFCRPHLLYATDCLGLTVTQMRSLRNTWQCAVSHIFNVSGDNVQFICSSTDDVTLDSMIVRKRIKFLQNLNVYHCDHVVLHNVFVRTGKQELFWLRTMLDL